MITSTLHDDKALIGDSITHAVADAAKDGILLTDTKQQVAFINNSLREWFLWIGIDTRHWIGMDERAVYKAIVQHAKDDAELSKLFISISTNELISDNIDIEFDNDVYRYIQMYTAPIFQEGKGYLGRLLLFENKTKERKVDQMKTEFISIASHQLRTPLSAIKGYLSMLMEGDAGELTNDVREFIKMALEGANRLVDIVEDLLNVSRLEMGKTTPQKEKKQVKTVIEHILMFQQHSMNRKQQKLELELPEEEVEFNMDVKLLAHVLGNVVDNAIKYTPVGGTITIRVRVQQKDERILSMMISDTGLGIPKGQQSHIFEKFFRADNVRTEDFTGTGIGLYYVYKLVSSLRGKVWFESEEGKGTTFYVEIPE